MEDDDTEEVWTEPFTCADSSENILDTSYFGRDHGSIPISKLGHSRTIVHIDIDCFYAQVEILRNPELKGKPLGIQQKNIVVTCNYEARKWGVTKLMYITDAKKKCPQLILVSGEDLTNYRHMSYEISEFLQKYTPFVERLGFDENFVDVSQMVAWRLQDSDYKREFKGHVYSSDCGGISKSSCECGCELRLQIGSQIAADMREALQKELGITSCAGVAHNKLLAKLVAATHKPNQQTAILPHMCLQLMTSLPSVRSIPGIGSRTSRRLQALGICAITDLQKCDLRVLEREFGSALAQQLTHLCYGVDDSPVVTFSLPQTLSDEDSFKCCKDYSDAEGRIKDLLTSVLKRVVEDGRTPQTVRLTVRRADQNYTRESRQCSVHGSIFTKCHKTSSVETACEQLMPTVMNLFSKVVDSSKPFHLTLINVCFAKLIKPGDEQGKISSFFTKASDIIRNTANQNKEDTPEQNADDTALLTTNSHLRKSQAGGQSPVKGKSIKHFLTSTSRLNRQCESEDSRIVMKNNSIEHLPTQDLEQEQRANASNSTLTSTSQCTSDLASCLEPDHNCAQLRHQPEHEIIYRHSTSEHEQDKTLLQEGHRKDMLQEEHENNLSQEEQVGKDLSQEKHGKDLLREEHGKDLLQEEHGKDLLQKEQGKDLLQEDSDSPKEVREEDFLQSLLPQTVDAHTIIELPNEIMKEVLLEHGILMEDLPDGRRFTLLSDKVTTRSRKSDTVTLKRKKPLSSPQKKRASKRTLTKHAGSNIEHASEGKKILLQNKQQIVSTEISSIPNSTESPPTSSTSLNVPPTVKQKTINSGVITDTYGQSGGQENCIIPESQGFSPILFSDCSVLKKYRGEETDSYSVFEDSTAGQVEEYAPTSCTTTQRHVETSVKLSQAFEKCHTPSLYPEFDMGTSQLPSDELPCSGNEQSVLQNSSQGFTSTSPDSDDWHNVGKLSDRLSEDRNSSSIFGALQSLSNPEEKSAFEGASPESEPRENGVTLPDASPESEHRENSVTLPVAASSLDDIDCEILEQHDLSNLCRSNAGHFSGLAVLSNRSSTSTRQELYKHLPNDVDPDVFAALPRNIQGEIMAHIMMGTSNSHNEPKNHTSILRSPPDKKKKDSTSPSQKGQNTLLSYFKKK